MTRLPVPTSLPLVFALLALATLPGLMERMRFENLDRELLLVADLASFRAQAEAVGIPEAGLLDRLAAAGANAVSVAPRSLADLEADGHVVRVPVEPGRTGFRIQGSGAAFDLDGPLHQAFGLEHRADTRVLAASGSLVWELPLLYPSGIHTRIQARGLQSVVRVKNSPVRREVLPVLASGIPEGGLVIFDDKEALGYPSLLRPAGEQLSARGARLGVVEFAGQRGVEDLARIGRLPIVAVHSIPEEELEKYPLSRVLPRWIRAAEERRVRCLYLRAFPVHNLPYDRATALEANLAYLSTVRARLAAVGYRVGSPLDPQAHLTGSRSGRFLGALAAGIALAWVAAYFRILPPFWLLFAGATLGVLGGVLAGLQPRGLVPNLLALLAGCTAPAAAVLDLREAAGRRAGWARLLLGLVGVYLASALAGMAITALLGDPGYVDRTLEFRGVKLVYLGPLALVACYDLCRLDPYRRRPRLAELAILGLALGLGAVYLMRSGNFSPVPATDAEHAMRDSLEASLPWRPRTKEVLIGYPALGALVAAAASADPFWTPWLALAGTVAGVSATNSFCHLKASFLDSLGRGAVGLLFGLPGALLGAFLYRLLLRRKGRRRLWVVAGYAGFGNYGDEVLARRLVMELAARKPRGVDLALLIPEPASLPEDLPVVPIRRRDPIAVTEALRHADLFATGPGGLVQDRSGILSPLYYLGLHALARALFVPRTAFLGEGFGPVSRPWLRAGLEWFARTSHLCLVRDEASRALAGPDAVLGSDLFFLGSRGPVHQPGTVLGICLRPLPGGRTCFALPLARALAEKARDRGLTGVRLLSAHPAMDRGLLDTVALQLAKEGHATEVADLTSGGEDQALEGLAALACMRLHVCFLAADRRIPLLVLPYDPKVEAFVEAGRYPHRATPEGDPTQAAQALSSLLQAPDTGLEALEKAYLQAAQGVDRSSRALDRLARHAAPGLPVAATSVPDAS